MKPNYFFNFKSQIFMFDMILSFVIIIVTVGILSTYYISTNENVDIYNYNYELMSGFTQTKINSLNNEEIRSMFIRNEIRNIDNTVAQQVAEFYHTGKIELARNLTKIYAEDYVNNQMNFRIVLYNSTDEFELYNKTRNKPFLENGTISSVSQRTIFGFINKTHTYGPDTFKVEIWM